MISLIIWSKDRAAQLQLLLDSIRSNAPDLFDEIRVIAKASSEEFRKGYELITDIDPKGLLTKSLTIHWEEDFYTDTMSVLKSCKENVALSTDDTVIYTPINPLKEEIEKELSRPDVCTFSLRYGFNVIVQNYHTGQLQPALSLYDTVSANVIRWPFINYGAHDNYGYPFGLDMHIYRRDLLLRLTDGETFKSTNELESLLFRKKHLSPPLISALKNSAAVNIPVNSISGITRAGEKHGLDLNAVNTAFLEGKRLSLKTIDTEIVGCHQEIPLEFEDE